MLHTGISTGRQLPQRLLRHPPILDLVAPHHPVACRRLDVPLRPRKQLCLAPRFPLLIRPQKFSWHNPLFLFSISLFSISVFQLFSVLFGKTGDGNP
jgi:hypothetical protein